MHRQVHQRHHISHTTHHTSCMTMIKGVVEYRIEGSNITHQYITHHAPGASYITSDASHITHHTSHMIKWVQGGT